MEIVSITMKVIVKKDKWIRGTSGSSSFLLDDNGNSCIMGSYCLAIGIEERFLRGKRTPAQIVHYSPELKSKFPDWLFSLSETRYHTFDDSNGACKIISFNDRFMDDELRQNKLTALFMAHGIDLEFV
jgi:hypothetical protein